MDELEIIRQKKMEEIQKLQQQMEEEAQLQQQVSQIEMIVKQRLTKDALSRFGNIKTAYPEKYIQLLAVFGQLISKVSVVDDNMLKEILIKLEPKHKFKIRRK